MMNHTTLSQLAVIIHAQKYLIIHAFLRGPRRDLRS